MSPEQKKEFLKRMGYSGSLLHSHTTTKTIIKRKFVTSCRDPELQKLARLFMPKEKRDVQENSLD